jgi:hypothetical protein
VFLSGVLVQVEELCRCSLSVLIDVDVCTDVYVRGDCVNDIDIDFMTTDFENCERYCEISTSTYKLAKMLG